LFIFHTLRVYLLLDLLS